MPLKFNLKDKVNQRRFLIAVFAIFIAFISIGALGIGFFSSSEACIICHTERPQYDSWKKSSHNEIPCLACHAPTGGALTFVVDRVSVGSRYVFKQLLGYNKPINADSKLSQEQIPKERCLRCHSPDNRNFTPKKGLTMNRDAHFKMLNIGMQCTTCHNRIAHKAKDDGEIQYDKGELGKDFRYKNYLDMREGCWRCHSRLVAAAPTKCSTCHTQEWKIKPDFHEPLDLYSGEELQKIIEKWRLPKDFKELLEGKPWGIRHGKIARKDMQFCQNCHENQGMVGAQTGILTCYSCHQVVVPHDFETSDPTKNWDKIHFLQKDRTLCLKCHKENALPRPGDPIEAKDPDFCHKCHHRSFAEDAKNLGIDYKGRWKSFHFQIVKNIGAERCFACHKPTFCAKCHVTGTKAKPHTETKVNKRYWSSDYEAWLK